MLLFNLQLVTTSTADGFQPVIEVAGTKIREKKLFTQSRPYKKKYKCENKKYFYLLNTY